MNDKNKNNSKTLTFAVVIAFFVFCVILIEVVLHLMALNSSFFLFLHPSGKITVKIDDPFLSWSLLPFGSIKSPIVHDVEIKINSNGFRGKEFERRKPKDAFRIFCMGDSSVYAMEVDSEEAYPSILEKKLKEKVHGKKVEVINAGVPGYETLQGLILLKRKILKYDPDLIVISYGFNDYTFRKKGHEDDTFIGDFGYKRYLRLYTSKLMLYKLVKRFFYEDPTKKPMVPKIFGADAEFTGGDSHRVPESDYIKNLGEIVETARNRNVKVVFFSLANPYRKQMKLAAEKYSVPFFDTTEFLGRLLDDIKANPNQYDLSKNNMNEFIIYSDAFSEIYNAEDMKIYHSGYFYYDSVHFNELGHLMIGEALARFILSQKDIL